MLGGYEICIKAVYREKTLKTTARERSSIGQRETLTCSPVTAGLTRTSGAGTALQKCPKLQQGDLAFAHPPPTDQSLEVGCPQGRG